MRSKPRPAPVREDSLRQLIERALPAAEEHASVLRQVKAALLEGDDGRAVALLRDYWDLQPST